VGSSSEEPLTPEGELRKIKIKVVSISEN